MEIRSFTIKYSNTDFCRIFLMCFFPFKQFWESCAASWLFFYHFGGDFCGYPSAKYQLINNVMTQKTPANQGNTRFGLCSLYLNSFQATLWVGAQW